MAIAVICMTLALSIVTRFIIHILLNFILKTCLSDHKVEYGRVKAGVGLEGIREANVMLVIIMLGTATYTFVGLTEIT
jgi:hypothetical protein